jgi:hypothetical protein
VNVLELLGLLRRRARNVVGFMPAAALPAFPAQSRRVFQGFVTQRAQQATAQLDKALGPVLGSTDGERHAKRPR